MIGSLTSRGRDLVRSWLDRHVLDVSTDPADVQSVTIRYLMYVLLPAWFLPGVADYVMHRRTRIEQAGGVAESAIHSLMMTEVGACVVATLLCEVNPALLALALGATGAHEATAIWDVRTAIGGGRAVRPAEQHIHSFLECIPFMATSALFCLHADQIHRARTAPWSDAGAWRLRLRERRLPARYLAAFGLGVTGLIAVPYGEELARCAIASRRRGRR